MFTLVRSIKRILKFLSSDDSFEDEGALEHSTPEVTRTVTTNSESNFQRKITVSQTQL